jgi:hypothetical protein
MSAHGESHLAVGEARAGRSAGAGGFNVRKVIGGRVLGLRGAVARDLADAGMATAEYAIATLAACGFAGLLVTLLKSGEVKGLLTGIIRSALSIG